MKFCGQKLRNLVPARASVTLQRCLNRSCASIPASDGSLCGSVRTIFYTKLNTKANEVKSSEFGGKAERMPDAAV
ncbi:MAG: hypothetical protein J6Y21_02460 [Clostridia bacterium]|nr:hypothetical protein [Clostridia bacterium]